MEQYNLSYWEWNSFFKDIDFLIIGSGIVGLSAAIRLKTNAPKAKVVIVDRGSLPIGASTRNAGFACFGSLSELIDDVKNEQKSNVISLARRRYEGLQLLRQRYADKAIGYEALGGYEIFRKEDEALYQQCQEFMGDFNKETKKFTHQTTYQNADEQIKKNGLGGVEHLIHNQAEGQLDTGKLMHTLLLHAQFLGVQFLGGLSIEHYSETNEKVILQTEKGWSISASKVLIATNGFARQLLPELEVRPARNHVLITQPIKNLQLKGAFHFNRGYVYLRNVGDRILLGGGRNLDIKGEEIATFGERPDIQQYLLTILSKHILPNQKPVVDRWWSGIMGVGKKKEPIIKIFNSKIVVAVRLGGMGVALGTDVGETAAGLLVDDLVK